MDSGPLCNIGRHALKLILNIMLTLYCRISVSGLEKLPAKGPYVITPNHLSLADGPLIMAMMPWTIGSQTFFLVRPSTSAAPLRRG
jgi:1-acyl-sn-glycerol-3-phosphate acyltransferase